MYIEYTGVYTRHSSTQQQHTHTRQSTQVTAAHWGMHTVAQQQYRRWYTIYGTASSPISVPPAFQQATPFGANTGGTNPAFWAVMAGAEFDSWLTVGITDGDAGGALSSIGIDFDAWTESDALGTSDGAVFWMAPDNGPAAGTDAVLAQLFSENQETT